MNQIRVNATMLFENIITELKNPAQIKVSPEEAFEYAKSAGARFIKLRFKGSSPTNVKGFQAGVLVIANGREGVQLKWGGKNDSNGNIDKTSRLAFRADKLGILWGFVPALPHNLKVLAGSYINDSAEWNIVDESDKREIADLAKGYAEELGWSKEKVARKTEGIYRQIVQKRVVKPIPQPVEVPVVEKQAPVLSKTITGPVFKKVPKGRPKLKTVQEKQEVQSEHNAVGDVHKG